MKHLLLAKDLWGIVDGSEVSAPGDSAAQKAEFKKRSQKALSTIVMSVASSQLYLITSCEEPASAWVALRNHFERETLVNKLMLKKQYFRMEMKEGTSIEAHIKDMKELTDRLAAINAPISEEDQVVTLLGSLPSSYCTLVTTLEARDTVSLSYVQQSLVREEQKSSGKWLDTGAGSGTGQALFTRQGYRNSKGHERQKRVCYVCGEPGHFQRDCPRNRGQQKPSKHKHKARPACMDSSEDANEEAFSGASSYDSKGWIVDSGASSHMTQSREFLTEYEEFDNTQKVCLGDGRTVEAIGKGNIRSEMVFKTSEPKHVTMYNVMYVPKLACNLFSVRAAATKGNTVKFGETRCWIRSKYGTLMGMGTLVNKLYYLDCSCSSVESKHVLKVASGAKVTNKTDLWHQRLGHLNETQLREMISQDMVKGIELSKSAELSFCEKCVEGKISRKGFKPSGKIHSTRKLQRVHSDVCGPMPTDSIGGKRYFVTFIDDYTRCCKVYFMKNKSEVSERFKEFELITTNECGLSVGTLRSDNGGEYLSKEFESYLQSKGIHHELSAPYTPAQNGVAERINRTLMERARAMLGHAGLPERYWAEAVATAAYLRNRTPTRALKDKITPFEKWYGRKPDLSHLRVFGCMAYAYIPDVNRKGKLSKKAEKLRFIGYSLQTKGYRLIHDGTAKIVVRRDVVFNEYDFDHDASSVEVPTNEFVVDKNSIDENNGDPNEESSSVTVQPAQLPNEEEEDERYPRRQRTVPIRYGIDEYIDIALLGNEEPQSINEALKGKESRQWKEAADLEYQSLMENQTWELVDRPNGRKPIGCRWVFKTKCGSDGKVERYKARLVAKGYTQKYGEDYDETFSPVVRYSSIRTILAFAVQNGMLVHQMDVVTAFLNGILEEEIYMDQPPGYVKNGKENRVCKLKKSIYGLKQSSRCWNTVLKDYLVSTDFIQSTGDPCIFVSNDKVDLTIIAVYVDDLIIVTRTPEKMRTVKNGLATRFCMKDLGRLHYCLGITIEYDMNNSMHIHQRQYIQTLLERYGLSEMKSSSTPADTSVKLVKDDGLSKPVNSMKYQSMVGSLLYAAIATRPDIAQAVGVVSKFNSCPNEAHLTAVKRIFRYLKGTMNFGLKYEKSADAELIGFADADWAGDIDDRHSTTGNVFIMAGGAISWLSRKQPVVSLSTTEAEYVSLCTATQEAVWLRKLLSDIKVVPTRPTTIREDNQGAIAVARNPVSHARTKHIDIKYHYVREALNNGFIELVYCPTEQMTADILTKPLPRGRYEVLRSDMGLKEF